MFILQKTVLVIDYAAWSTVARNVNFRQSIDRVTEMD